MTSCAVLALLSALAGPDDGVVVDPNEAQARRGPIARGDDAEARALIGHPPPELPVLHWLDGKPRTLASLAGRVIVIRSFTHTCPFCASTMPALERLRADYAARGVEVLGVYHPKPPRPVGDDEIARITRAFGLTFAVAVDPSWDLVRRWWLDADRHWTSVTWVLDRAGRVRWVHPGGEYHQSGGADHARCRADERELRSVLDRLTAEPAGARH